MNRIKNAFDTVKADEKLKNNTKSFLRHELTKHESQYKFRQAYKYATALTVVVTVIFGICGYSVLNTSVSYISIDVNPSVELALNRFDNVVETAAYNDGGIAILNNLDLKGKPYTDAIDILLATQEFMSYINENSEIDFTVVSDNEDRIMNGIQKCKGYSEYNSSCHGADKEIIAQAHDHGLSLGKYRAYLELFKYDSSVTADDCKNMTMHQIHSLIEEHTNENHIVENYTVENYSSENHSNNVSEHSHGHQNGHR